jgi:hypothetical protein
LAGRATARALEDLFTDRWQRAGGPPLELRSAQSSEATVRRSLPIGAATVALSRTDPQPDGNTIREVERLFEDAIAAADRLIYVRGGRWSRSRHACWPARALHRTRATVSMPAMLHRRRRRARAPRGLRPFAPSM